MSSTNRWVRNEIEIDAPVEKVWGLTIDVERWPSMTPTMTAVELLDVGPVRVGSRARVVQPGQRPSTWTVTRLEPTSCFEWRTKVGTVTMTARHVLHANGSGCTNLLEVGFDGFGAGLVRRVLGGAIGRAIAQENEGFRRAAERRAVAD